MPAHMQRQADIIHSVILNLAYISNTGIYSFRQLLLRHFILHSQFFYSFANRQFHMLSAF